MEVLHYALSDKFLYDGNYYTTKYTDDQGERTRTIRTIIDKTSKRIYELI